MNVPRAVGHCDKDELTREVGTYLYCANVVEVEYIVEQWTYELHRLQIGKEILRMSHLDEFDGEAHFRMINFRQKGRVMKVFEKSEVRF